MHEAILDDELRDGRRAERMHSLLQPDCARSMHALPHERSIDHAPVPVRPAPDDCEVLLRDLLLLHEQSETSRCFRVLRYKHETACLAIESIDERDLADVRDFGGDKL